MIGAPFRHIGGTVLADHGPLTLVAARELAKFYQSEARRRPSQDGKRFPCICGQRATALLEAAEAAEKWRRAAGWTNPEAADARKSEP
jgi:nucleoside diphosphate kinase